MVFSFLFGKKEDPEVRAYVETMLILAAADGDLGQKEAAAIAAVMTNHPKMSSLTENDLKGLIDRCMQAIISDGIDQRIREIARMLPSMSQRVDAIKMALVVALVDGVLAPTEMAVLQRMGSVFGLTASQVDSVVNSLR
jgi:tellurite resistance protein